MADWATIKAELQKVVDDASFDTGGTNEAYLLSWANQIVQEVYTDIDIRYLLASVTITGFTTSDSYKSLPTNFNKISDRFTKVRKSDAEDYIEIISLEDLEAWDTEHEDVTTNTYPDYVAIEGGNIHVYPMFPGDLYLMNYYKTATAMASTTNSPDLPYVYLVTDLIIYGVAGKYVFPMLEEHEKASEYYNDDVKRPGRFQRALDRYMRHLDKNNSRQAVERLYY